MWVASVVPYEHPTGGGVLRLLRTRGSWTIEFKGQRRGRWRSPDAAVLAAAGHRTGLPNWDQASFVVSDDLLRWRPLGESL
jgi:hypothetical protein